MNFDKVAFILVTKGSTRSTVSFVANNQIEISQPMLLLCPADDINGMVGTENHAHVTAIVSFSHLLCQTCRIGRRRVTQLMRESLNCIIVFPALFAYVAIGAYGETMQRNIAFLRPFGQGLRQQCKAWDKEQHTLASPRHAFGNFEAGKGLSRAASHNQLPSVSRFQPFRYGR